MREGGREKERVSLVLEHALLYERDPCWAIGGFDSNNESNLRVVEIARIYL